MPAGINLRKASRYLLGGGGHLLSTRALKGVEPSPALGAVQAFPVSMVGGTMSMLCDPPCFGFCPVLRSLGAVVVQPIGVPRSTAIASVSRPCETRGFNHVDLWARHCDRSSWRVSVSKKWDLLDGAGK